MPDQISDGFKRSLELRNESQYIKALEVLNEAVAGVELTAKDELTYLILKGTSNFGAYRFKEAFEAGEKAYLLSKKLNLIQQQFDALYCMCSTMFFSRIDEVKGYIQEMDRLFKILPEAHDNIEREWDLEFAKAQFHGLKLELDICEQHLFKSIEIAKRVISLGLKKVSLGASYQIASAFYGFKGQHDKALEYVLMAIDEGLK